MSSFYRLGGNRKKWPPSLRKSGEVMARIGSPGVIELSRTVELPESAKLLTTDMISKSRETDTFLYVDRDAPDPRDVVVSPSGVYAKALDHLNAYKEFKEISERKHRIDCPADGYRQRHHVGQRAFHFLSLGPLAVEDPRPEGLREEVFVYNAAYEHEGADVEEYLSPESPFSAGNVKLDRVIPLRGEIDKHAVREWVEGICDTGKTYELAAQQFYQQALFNKRIADYQSGVVKEQKTHMEALEAQLSQAREELRNQKTQIDTESSLKEKAMERMQTMQGELRVATDAYERLRKAHMNRGNRDPGTLGTFSPTSSDSPGAAATISEAMLAASAPAGVRPSVRFDMFESPRDTRIFSRLGGTEERLGGLREHLVTPGSSRSRGSSGVDSEGASGVVINPEKKYILPQLKHEFLNKFEADIKRHEHQDYEYRYVSQISQKAEDQIDLVLNFHAKFFGVADAKDWRTWASEKFLQVVRMCMNRAADGTKMEAGTAMDVFQKRVKLWNPSDSDELEDHLDPYSDLKALAKDSEVLSEADQATLAEAATQKLINKLSDECWRELIQDVRRDKYLTNTLHKLVDVYGEAFNQYVKGYRDTAKFTRVKDAKKRKGDPSSGPSADGPGKSTSKKQKKKLKWIKSKEGSVGSAESLESIAHVGEAKAGNQLCTGCGRNGHLQKDCLFATHPDFNTEKKAFLSSQKGEKYHKEFGKDCLAPTKFLQGGDKSKREAFKKFWEDHNAEMKAKGKKKPSGEPHPSTSSTCDMEELLPIVDDPLLPIQLLHTDGSVSIHRCLIDSGAIHNNYVDRSLEPFLEARGAQVVPCSSRINGALKGSSSSVGSKSYDLTVRFLNNKSLKPESFPLRATSIDLSNGYEMFIGRQTLKKYRMYGKLEGHLYDEPVRLLSGALEDFQMPSVQSARPVVAVQGGQDQLTQVTSTLNTGGEGLAGLRVVEDSKKFLDPEENAEGIELKDEEAPWQRVLDDEVPAPTLPCKIYGTKEEIEAQKELLAEFAAQFSMEVQPTAAEVPALDLDIDLEKWRSLKGNMSSYRTTSAAMAEEIKRQSDTMRKLGVIAVSKADRHSQVLMVKKPHSDPPKYRMCMDFVSLNSCTKSVERWPLPVIPEMIQRIGRGKPRYFAKMDLTSGYHQAPMSAASRAFTAFICWCGLFEWLRVPMGLKGAPSYFQRITATVVLVGLLWVLKVELYMDDLLVYGSTFAEYMSNLRQVLEALRGKKITLNPTKCEFGMSETEFVGYEINPEGYTLSDERKEAVFNIPEPTLGKQLKSFIGVAQYFHTHIPDFSRKIAPLQAMILDYDRNRRLEWTTEARKSWNSIREDIRQCQTLHYVREDAPVYLHTDASDYGIGGYLFQIIDGVEVPVAFMSKALSDAETRWSVTEKECYAFVYMFKKYEYLLRDRHFILRTDHRNLTYLNESASPKVRRWKILVQEFDFSIEYIKGEDNIVADATSRLVGAEEEVICCIVEHIRKGKQVQEIRWERKRDQRITENGVRWGKPIPPDNARPFVGNTKGNTAWKMTEIFASMVEIENPELREEIHAKWEEVKIPPEHFRTIGKHHNSMVGHHGVERTLKKLSAPPDRENGNRPTPEPWPQMREHVKKFIKTCPSCQKMSRLRTPIKTLGFTTASMTPMTRVSIDTIGPLPVDEDGNEYIIVIIDSFTRWVELYACSGADAQEAVKALLSYIKTFGQPSQLLSDNGTQFANQVVEELCRILGTEFVRTVAHSHQENAIVERVNKEVLRHLRALVFDDKTHSKWSKRLIFVQRILNTTEHESIGVAPCQLLFGNTIQLDTTPFMPLRVEGSGEEAEVDRPYLPISPLNFDGKPLSAWADEMIRAQEICLEKAVRTQSERDREHWLRRLDHLEQTVFPPGTWVKAMHPPTRMGWRPPNKLLMDWRGPYKVIRRHKGEYELQDPAINEPIFISEHLLEPYHIDHEHSTPIEVAIQDRNMSIIEAVLDVRGHSRQKKRLKLLIKWADEEEPRWMAWNSSFRHNKACQDFFWSKGRHWHWLIPPKFRLQYQAAAEGQAQAGARPRIRHPNGQRRRRLRQEMQQPEAVEEAGEAELAEEQDHVDQAEPDTGNPPVAGNAAGVVNSRPRRAGKRPAWLDEMTS